MSVQPCSVCGDPTEYCCADCRLNLKKVIYVCTKSTCRDIHEVEYNCNKNEIENDL